MPTSKWSCTWHLREHWNFLVDIMWHSHVYILYIIECLGITGRTRAKIGTGRWVSENGLETGTERGWIETGTGIEREETEENGTEVTNIAPGCLTPLLTGVGPDRGHLFPILRHQDAHPIRMRRKKKEREKGSQCPGRTMCLVSSHHVTSMVHVYNYFSRCSISSSLYRVYIAVSVIKIRNI